MMVINYVHCIWIIFPNKSKRTKKKKKKTNEKKKISIHLRLHIPLGCVLPVISLNTTGWYPFFVYQKGKSQVSSE